MNNVDAEKLAYYRMNQSELTIWNEFSNEVIENCKHMNIEAEYYHFATDIIETQPYSYTNGYSDFYGYFTVEFGDRGDFSVCILTKDKHQALYEFLKRIVWKISIYYECGNRTEFEKKWNYSTRYDGRKIHFELAISMLHQIYTYEELRDYIAERTNNMNRWFYDKHWAFLEDQNQFIEKSMSLEHD
jgi:hypothetical protein